MVGGLPSPSEGREALRRQDVGESAATGAAMVYRSSGLGVYAVVVRFSTMPLEKLAMVMNSSQVSGGGQLSKASKIVFAEGPLTPFRTVGRASVVAWFFQYSVMGFIFQLCDRSLSAALGVAPVVYGDQLMARPSDAAMTVGESLRTAGKLCLVPVVAGVSVERQELFFVRIAPGIHRKSILSLLVGPDCRPRPSRAPTAARSTASPRPRPWRPRSGRGTRSGGPAGPRSARTARGTRSWPRRRSA